jgi:hypothetical protein
VLHFGLWWVPDLTVVATDYFGPYEIETTMPDVPRETLTAYP